VTRHVAPRARARTLLAQIGLLERDPAPAQRQRPQRPSSQSFSGAIKLIHFRGSSRPTLAAPTDIDGGGIAIHSKGHRGTRGPLSEWEAHAQRTSQSTFLRVAVAAAPPSIEATSARRRARHSRSAGLGRGVAEGDPETSNQAAETREQSESLVGAVGSTARSRRGAVRTDPGQTRGRRNPIAPHDRETVGHSMPPRRSRTRCHVATTPLPPRPTIRTSLVGRKSVQTACPKPAWRLARASLDGRGRRGGSRSRRGRRPGHAARWVTIASRGGSRQGRR
jgi:hypothetical protein